MINHLTKWGFTRYTRFSAYKTGDDNVYPVVICGHCKALYDAYHYYSADDYIIIMEDDVHFKDVDRYNDLLMEVTKDPQFKVLVQTIPDGNPKLYNPPLKDKHAHMHMCIYKRETIPIMIHSLFDQWLRTGYNDQWWVHNIGGIYTYTGNECLQVNYYFPSSSIKRSNTIYAFKLILCDFPLDGLDVFDAFARAVKTTPEQLSAAIGNAKGLLIRLIRVDANKNNITHLDINNDIHQYSMSNELIDSIRSGDIQPLLQFALNNKIIPTGIKLNFQLVNAELLRS